MIRHDCEQERRKNTQSILRLRWYEDHESYSLRTTDDLLIDTGLSDQQVLSDALAGRGSITADAIHTESQWLHSLGRLGILSKIVLAHYERINSADGLCTTKKLGLYKRLTGLF